MTATVAGIHLGIDTHANRPAANTAPDGSLYSCSTHNLIYKSNFAGNSWATWATLDAAFSGCSLYNSATQTLTTATRTAVTFDTENYDTDAYHSTASNTSRITIPTGKDGKFRFTAFAYFANAILGQRFIEFRKNGTTLLQSARFNPGGNFTVAASVTLDIALVATDYMEVTVYQDSTGNLDIGHASANEVQHKFSAQWLGA